MFVIEAAAIFLFFDIPVSCTCAKSKVEFKQKNDPIEHQPVNYVFCLTHKEQCMYEREIHHKILTHLQKFDQLDSLHHARQTNGQQQLHSFGINLASFSIAIFYMNGSDFTPYPLILKNDQDFLFLKHNRLLRVIHSHRQRG